MAAGGRPASRRSRPATACAPPARPRRRAGRPGERGGQDAMGQLAQLLGRALGLVQRLLHQGRRRPRRARALARELQRDDGVDHPLLRAVVEVADHAPPLPVGRLQHPRARSVHLAQADPLDALGILRSVRRCRARSAITLATTAVSTSTPIATGRPGPGRRARPPDACGSSRARRRWRRVVTRPSHSPQYVASRSTPST